MGGKGRYQWYAFLAKPEGSAESEASMKPAFEVDGCAAGNPAYLREVFDVWSEDIHHIIRATPTTRFSSATSTIDPPLC